jgi:glyoxylase I family protein
VPVADLQVSSRWYEALFGRAADNNPMPTLVEWQVLPGPWVKIFTDGARAGSGLLNFAVDDLPTEVAGLRQRGSSPVTSPAPARTCTCHQSKIPPATRSA